MNLPNVQNQFQVVRRENPNAKRDFTISWGAKNEGIQPGDKVNGIILGFEMNDYKKKNIIVKSFNHGMQKVKIFGCTSIESELHSDQASVNLLWNLGDVIRVTYIKTYTGTKGLGAGKPISIFTIDELVGYNLTQEDVNDIQEFQNDQIKKQPLQAYKQPIQPPAYAQPAQVQFAVPNQYAQPVPMNVQQTYTTSVQPMQFANNMQVQQRASFKKSRDDDSFDI